MERVRKAVIPAAGLGTRFLPASAGIPKEMLPLGNRPALEWIVEEALAAGVEEIVLVLSPDKAPIRRYFEGRPDLVDSLEAKGKTEAAAALRRVAELGRSIRVVEQVEPLGLGHAVGCAESAVGGEPFLVLLGDAPVLGPSASAELAACFGRQGGGGVLGVRRVPREILNRYGIVGAEPLGERDYRVTSMVEKPNPGEAPGDLAINGRYLLRPEVFDLLREGRRGKGNEIQLTDALQRLHGEAPFCACEFRATRYDIGGPVDYAEAVVAFRDAG